MNYTELLTTNTRNDDYVNATKLCAAFNKRLDKFLKADDTKAFIEVLQSKGSKTTPNGGIMEVRKGKGGGTYVHPLIAIKLAEWLSPEFDVYVKETFKRYLEGDLTLATELVNKSNNLEEVKKHQEATHVHVQYLETYHGVHDQLKVHQCTGEHHGSYNKHVNQLAGVAKGQRGEMTKEQRLLMMAAQAMSEVVLIRDPDSLGTTALKVAKTAASLVGALPSREQEDIPVYTFD